MRQFVRAQLSELAVCMPAKVESFDADTQTVSVQPQIKRRLRAEDGTITFERLPVITKVPVVYMRAGGYFFYAPLEKGDYVVLHFVDYSMDEWFEQGREAEPSFSHSHELTDCFAVPGGYPKTGKLAGVGTSDCVVGTEGDDGTKLIFKANGDIEAAGNAEAVALSQKTLTELNKITTYLSTIHAVWQATIPEAGMGSPSSLATALKAATLSGVPSMEAPAAAKLKSS